MYIDMISEWIKLEYIQYLIMATIVLGLFKCLKFLLVRR